MAATSGDSTPAGAAASAPDGAPAALWRSVDRIVEGIATRGAGLPGLQRHKLGPLAAGWYERSGLAVPDVLREEERSASLAVLIATPLVRRIRATVDGPVVLLKGPEVATLYPKSGRRFSDVDILTPQADAAQAALQAAGFVEVLEEHYSLLVDHHHLHPLRFPTIWLNVEVHAAPNWPVHATPPPLAEILEAAVPSALGVEGVLAPCRAHHTLMLASHAWRHEPLVCVRDLVDLAVLADGVDLGELDALARRWGITRLWRTTWGAVEELFYDGRHTAAMAVLGRHLRSGRARSVFENHLVSWLSPYWELAPGPASAQMTRRLRDDLRPAHGETWRRKLTRTASAVLHPGASSTERS